MRVLLSVMHERKDSEDETESHARLLDRISQEFPDAVWSKSTKGYSIWI
jgi:hypothetical protein